jgi:allantoin racemase
MRIVWHIDLARGSDGRMEEPERLWTALEDYAAKVVNPGTKVELRFLEHTTSHYVYPYHYLVNNALLVEDVLKCQEEGVDAVMLAPAIDPALDESRGAAGIPVVGSIESAMAISQFVGRRVGIIGVRDGYCTTIEQNINRYGLRQRMIDNRPVRLWEMDYRDVTQALKGNGEEFVSQMERVARELIDDGADVIVGGCQFFGGILDRAGYSGIIKGTGVPFIDCAAAGLKMAESMVSLGRSVGLKKSECRFSPFRSMDPALIKEAAAVRRS